MSRQMTAMLLVGVVALLFPVVACGSSQESGQGETAGVGIPNERMPAAGLLTGGQVSQEQMTQLVEMGYTTFVNLRSSGEDGTGWEEEFADGLDLTFVRIPVASTDDLNPKNVDLLDSALSTGDGKAVVYCKSGNRVGALLALRAHWVDGLDAEAALALGRASGMTGLEPAVQKMLTAGE
jgi:uncharacterized protein (TIGR01244 family)